MVGVRNNSINEHQRVKSCEGLGIKKINCTVKQYKYSEGKGLQASW